MTHTRQGADRIGIVVRDRTGLDPRVLRRQLGALAATGASTRVAVMAHDDPAASTAGAQIVLDHRTTATGGLYRLWLGLSRLGDADAPIVVLFDDAVPHPAVIEAFGSVPRIALATTEDRRGTVGLLAAPGGAIDRLRSRIESALADDEAAGPRVLATRGGVPMNRARIDLPVPEEAGWIWPPRRPEQAGKIVVEVDDLIIEADEVDTPVEPAVRPDRGDQPGGSTP